MNLNEIDFKFAFQFMGLDPKTGEYTPKDDPSFVKIIVEVFGKGEGEGDGYYSTLKEIPYRKCTEEDFAEFHPIVEEKKQILDDLKDLGAFNCIDWKDEDPFLIFGDS